MLQFQLRLNNRVGEAITSCPKTIKNSDSTIPAPATSTIRWMPKFQNHQQGIQESTCNKDHSCLILNKGFQQNSKCHIFWTSTRVSMELIQTNNPWTFNKEVERTNSCNTCYKPDTLNNGSQEHTCNECQQTTCAVLEPSTKSSKAAHASKCQGSGILNKKGSRERHWI